MTITMVTVTCEAQFLNFYKLLTAERTVSNTQTYVATMQCMNESLAFAFTQIRLVVQKDSSTNMDIILIGVMEQLSNKFWQELKSFSCFVYLVTKTINQ